MKLRYDRIYHCLHCGNIVLQPSNENAPHCCGAEMAYAADQMARELGTNEDSASQFGRSRLMYPTPHIEATTRQHDLPH